MRWTSRIALDLDVFRLFHVHQRRDGFLAKFGNAPHASDIDLVGGIAGTMIVVVIVRPHKQHRHALGIERIVIAKTGAARFIDQLEAVFVAEIVQQGAERFGSPAFLL